MRRRPGERIQRSKKEEDFLARNRKLYPRTTHNERGEPVFDMSSAKALLRKDVNAIVVIVQYQMDNGTPIFAV